MLGFMRLVSCIYEICDISSCVFDHNSTKYFIAWLNILYISYSINELSVLEIIVCFQLLPKLPHKNYLYFTANLLNQDRSCFAMYNVCFKQVSIRYKTSSIGQLSLQLSAFDRKLLQVC